MRWILGLLAGLVGLVVALAALSAQAPGVAGLGGLYAGIITGAAFDQLHSRPVFGKVVSVDRVRDAEGVVERAQVEYCIGDRPARRAALMRRPAAYDQAWYAGQPMPVLVFRLDPSHIALSGLRKSAKRFSARNPLQMSGIDHVLWFGLNQSKPT